MSGATPQRFPNGMTTDFPFQPLALYGFRNPFFYHEYEDDFEGLTVASGANQNGWTLTVNANGTVAPTPGDGGRLLFTTNSSTPLTTDIASIQRGIASFKLVAGFKAFFMTRLQMADVTNTALIAGLIQTTATPFTVTDGVYFSKPTGAITMSLISMNTSVATTIAIPAGVNPLTNNVDFDLAWMLDRKGNLFGFIGAQLVGYIPQSGTGSTPPRRGAQVGSTTPPSLTAANLNLTLAIQSGTASSKTMNADFIMAAKER